MVSKLDSFSSWSYASPLIFVDLHFVYFLSYVSYFLSSSRGTCGNLELGLRHNQLCTFGHLHLGEIRWPSLCKIFHIKLLLSLILRLNVSHTVLIHGLSSSLHGLLRGNRHRPFISHFIEKGYIIEFDKKSDGLPMWHHQSEWYIILYGSSLRFHVIIMTSCDQIEQKHAHHSPEGCSWITKPIVCKEEVQILVCILKPLP